MITVKEATPQMMLSNINHKNIPGKVILSSQAYLSIVSEVSSFSDIETGGIFLGTIDKDTWYIIESIDPGIENIIREAGYFRYDVAYVNHLANIRYKLYNKELALLGLWHRHPGSMDYFSGIDKETNKKYVENSTNGSLAALINIDPAFRITMFYLSRGLHYTKLDATNIIWGDNNIPGDYLKLKDPSIYLDIINKKADKVKERLIKVFENEYTNYLSKQKDFDYEVQMKDESIEIELKCKNNEAGLPKQICATFSYSGKNQITVQFDNRPEAFMYVNNSILKYILRQKELSKKMNYSGRCNAK